MFNDYNDILTVDELCEVLLIGKNAAYILLAEGSIKAYQQGRVWKIPKQGIIDYVMAKSGIQANR